jgi:hypothetical protein
MFKEMELLYTDLYTFSVYPNCHMHLKWMTPLVRNEMLFCKSVIHE